MTEFNEPTRFCGNCSVYLCTEESKAFSNKNLIEQCRNCKSWSKDGIQLLNKDNVGQCWHCRHQTDREVVDTVNFEKLYLPYCKVKECFICGLKGQNICSTFVDKL